MFAIDLIERKLGEVDSKVILLDNLSPEDLDWIKDLAGNMTEEIYTHTGTLNRIRNCDSHLIDIDVVRVFVIKQVILLWTILQGNLRRHPQMDQLCAWLNETEHTHKGELMLREREVHEPGEQVGPEVLFGKSLEEALETAPHDGGMVNLEPAPEHYGDSMSEEDMRAMFDRGCIDFSVDDEPEKELLLVDEVKPRFEVDFEVEDGEPTELTDDDEFEFGFDALTASVDGKDLTEEVA